MANTFTLKIITPEKDVFNGEIISFNAKTKFGYDEFLANHATSIISLVPNIATIKTADGNTTKIFVSSGMIKFKDNELVVCCDAAEYGNEIDLTRAESAKQRAENRLGDDENKDRIDHERAKAALARAMVRLEMNSYNH